jgi:hypothetical protein
MGAGRHQLLDDGLLLGGAEILEAVDVDAGVAPQRPNQIRPGHQRHDDDKSPRDDA